ncbi:capsule biosynthesis protein [Kangiella marina]|uniref:Capsule biosynthesis protein n=1 Tax=Kangiella marina TaxID=1079178 RepID=A0ABP8IQD4_9GAMM
MNIGLVNIYAFRPHMEHLYFLAKTLEDAGHNTHFLTCDAALSDCYPRSLKDTSKLSECSKCIIGGIRSYPVGNVTSIKKKTQHHITEDELRNIALSSACTLNRTESDDDHHLAEVEKTVEKLIPSIAKTYNSATNWIRNNQLDGVVVFNGRMDVTRAITYACEIENVPFITHERTWFGDGLRLNPGSNCLSIKHVDKLVQEFDSKPLTKEQALLAGNHIAQRFLQSNTLEWRLYNANPEPAKWPINTQGKKVLVIPSSKNEFAGHDEWKSTWKSNTDALNDYMQAFNINPQQMVIRFHPNWAENIGAVKGEKSIYHYSEWANAKGVHVVSSDSKLSTYDLIQQADIVIMNGGSSAVEAGACGKEVICLGPSPYMNCRFVRCFQRKEELYDSEKIVDISPVEIIQSTLRYVYLRARRFPQYIDNVKARTTTRYEYYSGADPDVLIRMFKSNQVEAYDKSFEQTDEDELEVIKKIIEKRWRELVSPKSMNSNLGHRLKISRRGGFKLIDGLRDHLKRGDR